MNTLALSVLWALVRTGLVLSLSAIVVTVFLRVFRVSSPAVRRTAFVAVLLQGWLVFEGPFSLQLPSFVSKAVDWPAVADRLSQTYGFRVALGPPLADPPVLDRRPTREATGGQAASATQPSANEILREETATNGKESVRSGSIAGSNPSCEGAAAGPSTFTADDEGKSIASQKSTGGPKLPRLDRARRGPVAPEQEPIGSVAASVDMPPSHERPFPWSLALASLWATGIALIAGRSAWAYLRFARRFPASCETPPEWAHEWTSLQLEAGLRGTVPLVVAEHVGPVLCRLPRRYRLIVPGDAWRSLEPSQRLLVLRHELAHIERNDVWKSLAMRILALPHWFNPLVWQIVRRFEESAEWACDEAAAGAAPERIPDYARALLQLGQRAQPAFFAAPAARASGLAHRIRRLLTPGAKKETKMKLALMAVLLLGISLSNITRLQTRAESPDSPSAANVPKSAALAPQATANKSSATTTGSKVHGHLVTVAVPVTKTIMVPVTTTEVVPQQVFVEPSIDAPPPVARPVAEPLGVLASTPLQARADEQGPSADDEKTKTPPLAASPPIKTQWHNLRPGKALRGKVGSNVIEMLDGEIRFGPGPDRVVDVISMPREARVNLPYILQRMHRFQREQEELKASLAETEKRDKAGSEELAMAQNRLDEEKDAVIRSILHKGLTQQIADMQRERKRGNENLLEREQEMYHRSFERIMREIASYAKEHQILVVRRMPVANERRAEAAPFLGISAAVAKQPSLPVYSGTFGRQPVVPPRQTPVTAAAAAPTFTFVVGQSSNAPAQLTTSVVGTASSISQTESNSQSRPWDQEILYVAEVHGDITADISDEIVKRLNAADEAKHKASSAPTK
jgi:beta-lactamase regulating signal transducer with metallopeptidase domain